MNMEKETACSNAPDNRLDPTRAAPRFIDQIDADREAIRWLEERALSRGANHIEWHNHEGDGRTGSAWKDGVLVAATVVLRDWLNYSVLICHEVEEGVKTRACDAKSGDRA